MGVIRHEEALFRSGTMAGLSDGELLRRFLSPDLGEGRAIRSSAPDTDSEVSPIHEAVVVPASRTIPPRVWRTSPETITV
jgi:hypothetical protein